MANKIHQARVVVCESRKLKEKIVEFVGDDIYAGVMHAMGLYNAQNDDPLWVLSRNGVKEIHRLQEN